MSAHPVCPVCRAANSRYFFTKSAYAVFRCRKCGLEFLHPQPDDRVLASIYGASYFLGERTEEAEERTARLKSATARLYLEQLASLLPRHRGRLLEIGCGSGDFLLEARRDGFEVRGVEYSAVAANTANRRLGPGTVQVGTVDSVKVPSESLDVFVACDVIEHVRDPRSFLQRAYSWLSPGGLLFLVTPSLDSWSHKWMRRYWMEYKVEHLFYFGKCSLQFLLASAGFDETRFHANEKVVSFDYVYQHFRVYSVPIVTPLVSGLRRCLPRGILQRHWQLDGSGIVVTARKPTSSSTKREMM